MPSLVALTRSHRPLIWFSAAMAVLALVSAVGIAVDDRVLVGVPIWTKPFKFSVSFVAYGLTLAWMLSLLPRGRRVGWWAGTVLTLTGTVEMVLITLQVIRGTQSHFNNATPFDNAVFQLMGATVLVLWLSALVIAVLLLRARILDRALAWAVRLSSLIALAGTAVGYLMVRPTPEQLARPDSPILGAHSVGTPDGGPSMPLTGWAETGGDLRIAHFFGMHALQLLPLLLFALTALATRFTRLADERVRLRLTLTASAVYTAVFALLTWQALRGQALLSPDGTTLAAAGTILLLGGASTALSLRATTAAPSPEPTPASAPTETFSA
ncbi:MULTISPECIES: hypothetical protein [unclassified Streptomyces]|uniref:hypothetical protein n=1 Tax=unclassified Streptomyces TaxID=2593676 RepID=UPI001CB73242|nr:MULTISPECIES: hypothetical protein [unclassified Streptomyces]MBD0712251.1 hypothetical protein [Streptomyces sp. CBMA291]MBD0714083.1 hypothetical protein [Streptomyces sp. CBMA370]